MYRYTYISDMKIMIERTNDLFANYKKKNNFSSVYENINKDKILFM